MAPKQNAKAVAAKARKEEQEQGKKAKAAADNEAREAEKWGTGAKGKAAKESKAEAAEAARARKAERDRLLAEEEASQPAKVKAAPKAGAKKVPPKAPAIPSFSTSDDLSSFSASGIDDALDALSLATSRTDKAYVGSQAAKIETHPERRFKAAFEAYKEEQLPILKKEHPGLRLNQYQDKLYEAFKKSPQNPFNQAHMAHNASKDDKVAALQSQKDEIARRLGAK
ncbi:hypothetical protein JCM10450v2_005073 [Rhodotorula kratochvilovae]